MSGGVIPVVPDPSTSAYRLFEPTSLCASLLSSGLRDREAGDHLYQYPKPQEVPAKKLVVALTPSALRTAVISLSSVRSCYSARKRISNGQ